MQRYACLLIASFLIGCGGGGDPENGAAPIATTLAATSVGTTSASLNGNVTANGLETSAWFEWGTDPSMTVYSNTTTQVVGSGTTIQSASIPLNGLLTGTTYYFRIVASNSSGTNKGSIESFTPGSTPSVTTLAAISVNGTGGALNGNVTPNGLATNVWFEWGTDPILSTYTTTPAQSIGSGTTSQQIHADLTGLTKGTTYYFRAVASNSSGTTRDSILSFLAHLQGEFGNPFLLEHNDVGGATTPQVAISDTGDAISVWAQSDGTRDNIWANRYSASTQTWSGAILLEVNDLGTAATPQIAMDANGNSTAVWEQSIYRKTILANRFSAITQTWAGAVEIDFFDGWNSINPQIAMSANGDAIAVWAQSDGTRYNIWANRYSGSKNSWFGLVKLEANDNVEAIFPQIAMSDDGNAMAVWKQDNVWANRYSVPNQTWSGAYGLSSDYPNGAIKIGMSGDGGAIAVWVKFDGGRQKICASQFSVATQTWSEPFLLESHAVGDTWQPQIAMSENGDAIAVWRHAIWGSNDYHNDIWANRFSATTQTWSGPFLIESNDNENESAAAPQVAMSADGNAIAVWAQLYETRYHIWANRYSATTQTWSGPFLIEANSIEGARNPQVAMSADGNAIVVWEQFDGTRYNIWANRTY